MGKAKMIEWDEPWDAEGKINLICRMTTEDAIKAQYKSRDQIRPNFIYKSDDDALADFMAIHWARMVNAPD